MAGVYQLRQHGSVPAKKHLLLLLLPVSTLVLAALMMHYLGVIPD